MLKDLYLVHLSIHGLIRGTNLELGRDADTGGQCKYVLELVKALAEHPSTGQVDLFTRQIIDPKVSADYKRPEEKIAKNAFVKRVPAGPKRYLRKETLWRHLDEFVDQCLARFREAGRLPDVIHGHYADAGYVGSQLASLLGCPFIFTGHSLGRTKKARLLVGKADPQRIEKRYNLGARLEAEEMALDAASFVCTSTTQEVEEQYSVYENYDPARMRVIPPGVDVDRFAKPVPPPLRERVVAKLGRFLRAPDRPAILAIARADEKKNLSSLVKAYGQNQGLQEKANLVIVAGNRESLSELNAGARRVWTELLQLIDDFDLHGRVAIPKQHEPDEIPAFYQFAEQTGGLFVNPALTEPFGLTLIEAASAGTPVVATHDGGPQDILANCQNGLLVDPTNIPEISQALSQALSDQKQWRTWSASGKEGVRRHYSWPGHVERYLKEAEGFLKEITEPNLILQKQRTGLPLTDRIVFTGLSDDFLEGDAEALASAREILESDVPKLGFGIASGRDLKSAISLLRELGLPQPDVYITQLGADIHYGSRKVLDKKWHQHLSYRWDAEGIRQLLEGVPGIRLQTEKGRQHPFKISYHYETEVADSRRALQRLLREANLAAKVILSQDSLLDIIPIRSGKGLAIRHVAWRWGIPADNVLFYARRGSDYEALSGQFLGVLGSDHSPELKPTAHLPRVYASPYPNFRGLLDGIRAYQFDTRIRVPKSAQGLEPVGGQEQESALQPDVVVHFDKEE
ncbi:MAG: HAD family hydrolase [Verrucomicrobiota bacterium]